MLHMRRLKLTRNRRLALTPAVADKACHPALPLQDIRFTDMTNNNFSEIKEESHRFAKRLYRTMICSPAPSILSMDYPCSWNSRIGLGR